MKNNNTINKMMQGVINEEKVKKLSTKHNYEETARKATVSVVLRYHLAGSIEECESLREVPSHGMKHGLVKDWRLCYCNQLWCSLCILR